MTAQGRNRVATRVACPRGTPRGHDATATLTVGQLGAAIILGAALLHAATNFSPLPWWDMSPLVVSPSMNGMGPAQALVTDALLLMGAMLVFLGEARRREPLHFPVLILAALGVAGVVLHGWILPTSGLANRQLGASWAAAVIAMVAMLHACRDERTRRLAVAVILGFVALLAIKGAQQTFIEHPRTVENFEQNREQILAAQGWTPDSPMARGYERRLRQPDPSAWFGLSNVYASFMAAGAAAMLAATLVSVRPRRRAARWTTIAVAAAGLAALGALLLTYSKGGIGALALGLATCALLAWLQRPAARPRTARLAGFVLLTAVALPIIAVVLRGSIGERLGDRSLLFRWYYWQGAARIATDHPITGVGPAGFQEAYLAARPPLSVEEVTSPHSLPFDWWATLGVFGVAWIALFVLVVWRIAQPAPPPTANLDPPGKIGAAEADRQESRLAFLIAAMVALLGTWLDMQVVLPHGPTVTPDRAAVWLAGLIAWWLVTAAALRLARANPALPTFAAAAAAVVLAIHAQIEVTPVQTGSAALFFIVLGAAAARPRAAASTGQPRYAPFVAAAGTGVLALLIAHSAWRARDWQGHLREAAEILAPIADIRGRLSVPDSDPQAARHRREALVDLGQLVGRPVDAPEPWLTLLQVDRIPGAVGALTKAEAVFPEQWRIRRSAAWLLLDAAASVRGADLAASDRFLERAQQAIAPDSAAPAWLEAAAAGELRAYATLLENVAVITGEKAPLEKAVQVLEKAATRDPFNLPVAVALARHHEAIGHPEEAGRWAARALELDGFKRLDQDVHGLAAEDRAAMDRLANP